MQALQGVAQMFRVHSGNFRQAFGIKRFLLRQAFSSILMMAAWLRRLSGFSFLGLIICCAMRNADINRARCIINSKTDAFGCK
jgi:hypothetical protein